MLKSQVIAEIIVYSLLAFFVVGVDIIWLPCDPSVRILRMFNA